MNDVKLISITNSIVEIDGKKLTPEELIVYVARVSSPSNQDNLETAPKLIKYLVKHAHWSPFELVDLTFEISTSRAIAAQILRHRSFNFQEYSLRYAAATDAIVHDARRQDLKNRQNSIDDLSSETKEWFINTQKELNNEAIKNYNKAIELGIAKESARFLLPLSTKTRMYMKGSVRSWIHYFQVRCDVATQKEHRDIANAIRDIFYIHFPNIKLAIES